MTLPIEQLVESEFAKIVALESNISLEERCERIELLRRMSSEARSIVDRLIVSRLIQQWRGLEEAKTSLAGAKEEYKKLAQEIEELKKPPWSLATVQDVIETPEGGRRVLVSEGGGQRVVNIAAEGVDIRSGDVGTVVFLSREANVIMGKWEKPFRAGDTAYFEGILDPDHVILRHRDETYVARATGNLAGSSLSPGDVVRFDRASLIANERLDGWRRQASSRRYEFEESLDYQAELVGGNEQQLEVLLDALTATLISPERASAYGLRARQSVLAYGPPGCGKTLMFRVAATRLQQLSGKKCCLSVVKPGEWRASYVGETEENIRSYFQWVAERAKDGPVVCVFDEIDGVGRARGTTHDVYDDKFLASLLVELDGFKDRGNVALCAATNRRDLLDPALYERVSDVEIRVGRPRRRAAEAIFSIHLPESVPFSPNGDAAADTRSEIIQRAVSRLYAPNNDENQLCAIRFRDSSTRVVSASDLISGRQIEQICRHARRLAFSRENRGGSQGIQIDDMDHAVSEALGRMATMLTPRNARVYLEDLPQDLDIVAVEPVASRGVGRRAHHFITGT
jgi:ATP-dependent 26S proteasome regulatory subunit